MSQCLIFVCYNISICKKEKNENSWNQWKSIEHESVSQIFFRCFIFDCYNISICIKGKVKQKFMKPMEVKLRSKMSHWPKIRHRYEFDQFSVYCEQYLWKWNKKKKFRGIISLNARPETLIFNVGSWSCSTLYRGSSCGFA